VDKLRRQVWNRMLLFIARVCAKGLFTRTEVGRHSKRALTSTIEGEKGMFVW